MDTTLDENLRRGMPVHSGCIASALLFRRRCWQRRRDHEREAMWRKRLAAAQEQASTVNDDSVRLQRLRAGGKALQPIARTPCNCLSE
jgi:hypothetical protein